MRNATFKLAFDGGLLEKLLYLESVPFSNAFDRVLCIMVGVMHCILAFVAMLNLPLVLPNYLCFFICVKARTIGTILEKDHFQKAGHNFSEKNCAEDELFI